MAFSASDNATVYCNRYTGIHTDPTSSVTGRKSTSERAPQNTVGSGRDETLAAVENLREMGKGEVEEERYDPGSPATSCLVKYVPTPKDQLQHPQPPAAAAEIPSTAASSEGNGPTTSAPTGTHAADPCHR